MSDSLQPFGLQRARLLCQWYFSGKNTGVGCHFLLQGIFPTQIHFSCIAGRFFTAEPSGKLLSRNCGFNYELPIKFWHILNHSMVSEGTYIPTSVSESHSSIHSTSVCWVQAHMIQMWTRHHNLFAAESSQKHLALYLEMYCQEFEPFESTQFVSNPASTKQSYFDGSSISSKNSP